ncbi:MAG: GSCFA domain-containing protein [Paludibacteraceae bacterium]|nr:GSCFA domain-containing protein [Paludibacteraceae bacterium]
MTLTTPVLIPAVNPPLRVSDRILTLGSCFADSMAQRMNTCYLQVVANPFGTLYNPLSIAEAIRMADLAPADIEAALPLVQHDGLWHSFAHHGAFSSARKEDLVSACTGAIETLRETLAKADLVIVTFGTAWIYERNGHVVANCHKLPADTFTRRRLTTDEILATWTPILQHYHDRRWLFTVSPIRHVRDGLHANSLSKAVLLLAVEQLVQNNSNAAYFPAYELLMDELRDYRFYDADLVHPSDTAVQYIWERFTQTWFDEQGRHQLDELHRLWLDEHHRVLHPDSHQARTFAARLAARRSALAALYPWLTTGE